MAAASQDVDHGGRFFSHGGPGEFVDDALQDCLCLLILSGVDEVDGFDVEQLRRPFGGVDLGDLRRHHQARQLEQHVVADVLVLDDVVRMRGIAQS